VNTWLGDQSQSGMLIILSVRKIQIIIQIINTDGMLMRHSVRSGVKKKPLQAKYPGRTMLHSVRSGVKNKPLRAKYPGHTLTAPFENKAETKPNCGSSPIPSP